MKVQRFNITKPRKFMSKDGQEKTQWNTIGTLTEFHKDDGSVSRLVEIPAIGLEAQVFPFQKKDAPDDAPKSNDIDYEALADQTTF